MWVGPAVVTGIGLIIHNKKISTHTVYDSPSSSSSSDDNSEYAQWKLRFIKELEFITYGSATVNPQTIYWEYNKSIEVTAYISAGNDNDFVHAAERVKSAYKKVAKKCPYASKLKISR